MRPGYGNTWAESSARKAACRCASAVSKQHVHLLFGAPPTVALAAMIQRIKGVSSHWMNANFPEAGRFAWQDGYAAYSVSQSALGKVADYIGNQREHHRVHTFEEEYRKLLDAHEVAYDEKYLF